MKVILQKDIKGVGRKFDLKEVSEGYANNFLFPKNLAERADKDAIKRMEKLKESLEKEKETEEKLLEDQVKILQTTKIVLSRKTNEKGHLFEKVHPKDVVLAIKNSVGFDLNEEIIEIKNPIKEIGEHKIKITKGKISGEFVLEVL